MLEPTVWKSVFRCYEELERILFWALQDNPDNTYTQQKWLRALEQKQAAQRLWLGIAAS